MSRPTLRPRRIYWRPAGGFVGFGRHEPEQPDLMESEYRFGWWIAVICRVCLLAEQQRLINANAALQAEVDHIKQLARAAGARVGAAVGIIEKKIDARRDQ